MQKKNLLYAIIEGGTSPEYSGEKNEKIRILNFVLSFFTLLSLPFSVFTYIFFPQLLVWTILFMVMGLVGLFLNRFGAHSLAKYVISVVFTVIYSIYHASIMQPTDGPIAALFVLQILFFIVPFMVMDYSEKNELVVLAVLNALLLLLIPQMNDWFDYKVDSKLFKTGILYYLTLITFFLAAASAFAFMFYASHMEHEKTEKLLSELKKNNEEMAAKEQQMQQYMAEIKKTQEEDAKRNWASEGLSQIAFILRQAEDLNTLADTLLVKVVKYINANQGAVFLLETEGVSEQALIMKACYAYGRKKYIKSSILPGEGLVGQCFLEADTIFITEVPKDHIRITSGLGEAPPRCLLIVPLKYNEQVLGVMELASFHVFEKHEIEFVEKVAENVAAVISSVRIAERTKELLEQSQQQQEEMRAQEEEMRQNMEELMATQEEIHRKQLENNANLEYLNFIIDNIPHPIFIKDEEGKYVLVNEAEARLLGLPKSNILGKDDSYFVTDPAELEQIRQSDRLILENQQQIDLPEQILHLEGGKVKVLHTTKKPFRNHITGKLNILGVSVETTIYKK